MWVYANYKGNSHKKHMNYCLVQFYGFLSDELTNHLNTLIQRHKLSTSASAAAT